jgi:hypothetical protein
LRDENRNLIKDLSENANELLAINKVIKEKDSLIKELNKKNDLHVAHV